jgi:hypothetical protein
MAVRAPDFALLNLKKNGSPAATLGESRHSQPLLCGIAMIKLKDTT